MAMLRLVERVMGEGDLYRRGERLRRVAYELSRYRQFAVQGADLVPSGEIVDGHLHADADALEGMLGTTAPLTLHLDDGRRFDFYVINADGIVTAADERGFYAA